jgi:hypothetical protein
MYLTSREIIDKTKDIRVRSNQRKRGSKVTSLDLRFVFEKDRATTVSPDNKSLYLASPNHSENVRQSYGTKNNFHKQLQ